MQPGFPTQECRSPGQAFRNILHNIARLEKCVGVRVPTSVALKTLHKDNRWDERRPHIPLAQSQDKRGHLAGADGEPADAARVEDQHVLSTNPADRSSFESPRD